MVFNRKKCEGMGEGLLLAMTADEESAASSPPPGEDGGAAASSSRLMLLLRIAHQVFMCNCPTAAAAAMAGAEGDADKWEKSSQLRSRLGEIAIVPLWRALAGSLAMLNDDAMRDQYQNEVRGMIDEWKEHNVFGGPTVLDEYKRGWSRALKEAADAKGGEVAESAADVCAAESTTITTKTALEGDDNVTALSQEKEKQRVVKDGDSKDESDNVEMGNTVSVAMAETSQEETKGESSSEPFNAPMPSSVEENGEGKAVRAANRDSVASVEVEVNFEGVEEAKVEPSQFLDACKVIASIQITRDLGSDAAMNLSSALSSIPQKVEEACDTILAQQQNGQDERTPITELLSTDALSNLPDEVLDLDLKYARKSLQAYKEAIRQQRKARLQCLDLLLQSRCSFGSLDAARAFCGGGDDKVGMDTVLEKLKKRKEILIDAMALEGLDVEEDEEEKKMEGEEEGLKPLGWFPGQMGAMYEEVEDEPAAKKIKSC